MAELPELGKHCSKDDCNKLDFLPLFCKYCNKIFCKDHHSVTEHSCSEFLERDIYVESKPVVQVTKCSVVGCEDACGVVHHSCASCGSPVCLKHRHESPKSHACPSKAKPKATVTSNTHREQFAKAFNAVEAEINVKLEAASHGKKKATADRLKLMRLKSRAVCPARMSVPLESRAYFTASYQRSTPPSSIPMYVSKLWSLGKVIDVIEKLFGLNTKSNPSNQKSRLILERNSSTICSDMSRTISALLADNVLVEGDTLVLEYIDTEKI